MYENDRLNVGVGLMDKDRANTAMQALINVLSHKAKDRTRDATFYQNPKHVDKFNRDWNKRYGLNKTGYAYAGHVFWKHPNQPKLADYENFKGDTDQSDVENTGSDLVSKPKIIPKNRADSNTDSNFADCYNVLDKGKYLKIRLNGKCDLTARELEKAVIAKYGGNTILEELKEHVSGLEYKYLEDDKNLLGYRTLFMSKR
jgi:hypothetical protein